MSEFGIMGADGPQKNVRYIWSWRMDSSFQWFHNSKVARFENFDRAWEVNQ